MYAIVSTTGTAETVLEKLGTEEQAYREMREWMEYAERIDDDSAAKALFGSLRVEVLH